MFEARVLVWACLIVVATGCGGSVPEEVEEPATTGAPQRVIYQSERAGGVDVWVMNGDGSEAVNLTGNAALSYNDRHPTASTDGGKIAFRSDRDGNPDVFIMNADGTEQTNLSAHEATDIDPSFSPDGARITFDSDRDGNLEIYVMDADGSNQVRLTDNEALDSHPFWSPDGRQITFYSNRDNLESEAMDIYVLDVDDGGVTRLTDDPSDNRYPSWSPDGTQITFSSDRDGNAEIYTMSSDGSHQARLTDEWRPRSRTRMVSRWRLDRLPIGAGRRARDLRDAGRRLRADAPDHRRSRQQQSTLASVADRRAMSPVRRQRSSVR